MDPMELWRQWYETSTKMWSGVFQTGQKNYMDPYGIYRQWFNGLEEMQQLMLGSMGLPAYNGSAARSDPASSVGNNLAAMINPAVWANPAAANNTGADAAAGQAAEVQNQWKQWKQWFEAVQYSWEKAAALGRETVELTPRWISTLDQIRNNLLSAEGYPTDPLQFATRWYNATSGPLSDFIGDLIEREDFLEISSQFLQSYASFYKVYRRNSEEYLKALSLPVRSDVARVAGLVVALEDKIDRVEEAFEDFEYGYAKPATAESIEGIEERIGRIDGVLERIEGGSADGATADSVSGLERRLDGVEGKIDRLIAAFESSSQNAGAQTEAPQETPSQEAEAPQDGDSEVRATAAARRRAEELNVDLSDVEGTGNDGQITVDDVRKKGAS
jgi:pyruvate/2-oxoglutarate dehydrogenase complex dihydrolipoamide acyltransferase (E2) component